MRFPRESELFLQNFDRRNAVVARTDISGKRFFVADDIKRIKRHTDTECIYSKDIAGLKFDVFRPYIFPSWMGVK